VEPEVAVEIKFVENMKVVAVELAVLEKVKLLNVLIHKVH